MYCCPLQVVPASTGPDFNRPPIQSNPLDPLASFPTGDSRHQYIPFPTVPDVQRNVVPKDDVKLPAAYQQAAGPQHDPGMVFFDMNNKEVREKLVQSLQRSDDEESGWRCVLCCIPVRRKKKKSDKYRADPGGYHVIKGCKNINYYEYQQPVVQASDGGTRYRPMFPTEMSKMKSPKGDQDSGCPSDDSSISSFHSSSSDGNFNSSFSEGSSVVEEKKAKSKKIKQKKMKKKQKKKKSTSDRSFDSLLESGSRCDDKMGISTSKDYKTDTKETSDELPPVHPEEVNELGTRSPDQPKVVSSDTRVHPHKEAVCGTEHPEGQATLKPTDKCKGPAVQPSNGNVIKDAPSKCVTTSKLTEVKVDKKSASKSTVMHSTAEAKEQTKDITAKKCDVSHDGKTSAAVKNKVINCAITASSETQSPARDKVTSENVTGVATPKEKNNESKKASASEKSTAVAKTKKTLATKPAKAHPVVATTDNKQHSTQTKKDTFVSTKPNAATSKESPNSQPKNEAIKSKEMKQTTKAAVRKVSTSVSSKTGEGMAKNVSSTTAKGNVTAKKTSEKQCGQKNSQHVQNKVTKNGAEGSNKVALEKKNSDASADKKVCKDDIKRDSALPGVKPMMVNKTAKTATTNKTINRFVEVELQVAEPVKKGPRTDCKQNEDAGYYVEKQTKIGSDTSENETTSVEIAVEKISTKTKTKDDEEDKSIPVSSLMSTTTLDQTKKTTVQKSESKMPKITAKPAKDATVKTTGSNGRNMEDKPPNIPQKNPGIDKEYKSGNDTDSTDGVRAGPKQGAKATEKSGVDRSQSDNTTESLQTIKPSPKARDSVLKKEEKNALDTNITKPQASANTLEITAGKAKPQAKPRWLLTKDEIKEQETTSNSKVAENELKTNTTAPAIAPSKPAWLMSSTDDTTTKETPSDDVAHNDDVMANLEKAPPDKEKSSPAWFNSMKETTKIHTAPVKNSAKPTVNNQRNMTESMPDEISKKNSKPAWFVDMKETTPKDDVTIVSKSSKQEMKNGSTTEEAQTVAKKKPDWLINSNDEKKGILNKEAASNPEIQNKTDTGLIDTSNLCETKEKTSVWLTTTSGKTVEHQTTPACASARSNGVHGEQKTKDTVLGDMDWLADSTPSSKRTPTNEANRSTKGGKHSVFTQNGSENYPVSSSLVQMAEYRHQNTSVPKGCGSNTTALGDMDWLDSPKDLAKQTTAVLPEFKASSASDRQRGYSLENKKSSGTTVLGDLDWLGERKRPAVRQDGVSNMSIEESEANNQTSSLIGKNSLQNHKEDNSLIAEAQNRRSSRAQTLSKEKECDLGWLQNATSSTPPESSPEKEKTVDVSQSVINRCRRNSADELPTALQQRGSLLSAERAKITDQQRKVVTENYKNEEDLASGDDVIGSSYTPSFKTESYEKGLCARDKSPTDFKPADSNDKVFIKDIIDSYPSVSHKPPPYQSPGRTMTTNRPTEMPTPTRRRPAMLGAIMSTLDDRRRPRYSSPYRGMASHSPGISSLNKSSITSKTESDGAKQSADTLKTESENKALKSTTSSASSQNKAEKNTTLSASSEAKKEENKPGIIVKTNSDDSESREAYSAYMEKLISKHADSSAKPKSPLAPKSATPKTELATPSAKETKDPPVAPSPPVSTAPKQEMTAKATKTPTVQKTDQNGGKKKVPVISWTDPTLLAQPKTPQKPVNPATYDLFTVQTHAKEIKCEPRPTKEKRGLFSKLKKKKTK